MFLLFGIISGFKYYRLKNNKLFVANKNYPHFKQLTEANIKLDVGMVYPEIIRIKNN